MINKNKGFATIVILGIIVGILVIGGGAYYVGTKKNTEKEKIGDIKNIENEEEKNNIENEQKDQSNIVDNSEESNNWIKSPKFGIYYSQIMNITEYTMDKNGIPLAESKPGRPVFIATFGKNQNTLITWGGGNNSSCMDEDDFGVFKYGESSIFCLKGHKTWIAHISASDTITKEELNIFGDFVLKNKTSPSGLEVLVAPYLDESNYIAPTPTLKAYDLVNQKWGGCKIPYTPEEACFRLDVNLNKISNNSYSVTAVYDGMYDDSVQNIKREGLLNRENENSDWILGNILNETWSCKRGHSDYSKINCL